MNVTDRLYLWGHEPGAHNGQWNLPGESWITPSQAAADLGVPNVIMVRYGAGFDPERAATDLQPLRRVVWSIVGAGGRTEGHEVEFVRRMAARYPHWRGVMMDDFFHAPGHESDRLAVYTPEELRAIQDRLTVAGRKLDLWVVLYDHQLDQPLGPYLEQCNVVTFWTWSAANLDGLPDNMQRLERLAAARRKVLGCYMWDYGERRPMPLDAMRRQCELGLKWLREGRIEGMIFLASCICDLGLEAVEWTRDWVRQLRNLASDPLPADLTESR